MTSEPLTGSGATDPFTTAIPRVDEREAAFIASRLFGLSGRITRLTSERDANFRILAEDGRAFVLKIGNEAEDPSIADLQTKALRHIAARSSDLPVPRACGTLDGQDAGHCTIAAGTRHVVRLLTFLPGDPLAGATPSLTQAANLGRCLAAIGLALSDFRHPAADHDLVWDLRRAARLRALLPSVASEHRVLAARALDRFEAEVMPRLDMVRKQVVHNDLNPHNVLVDPADPTRIAGVLDFGDMVETNLINDVAVAAAYQVDSADMLAQLAAFVGGYHAVAALTPEEIDMLPELIAVRQAMTLLIAGWRAELHPGNRTYLLRHTPRAMAALDRLGTIGRPAILDRLRRACGLEG